VFDKDNVKRTLEVLKGKVLEDFGFTLTDAEMLLHMERAQIERRNQYIARQLNCLPSDGLRYLIDEARKPFEESKGILSKMLAGESKEKGKGKEEKVAPQKKVSYARTKKR
jgi:hypothetical protein